MSANEPVVVDTNTSTVKDAADKPAESSVYIYIITAVISVGLIIVVYYAYTKFNENKESKTLSKADKDENIVDYNLLDEIKKLEKEQATILRQVSQDVGI